MKVYFKLSKKKLATSTILDLTPNKLYEVTFMSHPTLYTMIDDSGYKIAVNIDKDLNPHLGYLTHWIKHRPNKAKRV